MAMTRATIQNVSKSPAPPAIEVQFNPSEYTHERGSSYTPLEVPGLRMPLLQFVRGDTQTLTMELFLDGTDTRASLVPDQSVKARLEALRTFVTIDPDLHAPPVCLFQWQDLSFTGVVASMRERVVLFDEAGKALRAKVTLTLKSYESVEVQLRSMRLMSPDRTRIRVLREGETLAHIALEAYGSERFWSVIAEANNIDRPRFVRPGTPLYIPSL